MDHALLNEVSEVFASYLSEVTDGDLAARTPCAAWDVDDLYRHMLNLNLDLGHELAPQAPVPPTRGQCALRETIYRDAARYAADALANAIDTTASTRAGGAPSSPDTFGMHLTNTLVHTWDLAQAIQFDFDPPRRAVLDIALGCLRQVPSANRAHGAVFAPIPDFPAASTIDEILLLSGRCPGWRTRPA